MAQQIILKNLRQPTKTDMKEDIRWIGNSLGFYTGREEENITAMIFNHLLTNISDDSFSTENISENLGVSSQKINYHLKTLLETGFVCREKRKLFLREKSIKATIEEIRQDANRIFDNLSRIGEEIDRVLGLENRR